VDCRIDESKLRQWCWTKYRGRNDYKLRIFVTYSLNPPSGPLSVYAQHRRFLATKQDSRCHRLAFIQDLRLAIELAWKDGEQVIVMLRGNHNMKDSPLESQQKSLDLKEAIILRHGPNGPTTFQRNTSRMPIDGMWTSSAIEISQGGYMEYDQFLLNADHRCLWIDITYQQAFGHKMVAIPRPSIRVLDWTGCHQSGMQSKTPVQSIPQTDGLAFVRKSAHVS
jgi:endonuclease/exonuclease/phosphatase family metal-dependent hydrolase